MYNYKDLNTGIVLPNMEMINMCKYKILEIVAHMEQELDAMKENANKYNDQESKSRLQGFEYALKIVKDYT